ncbi:pyridoxamine 5'-phosphate oxidase family protein [Pseudonocardia abyssalis]|uniref:Pyridoxamine 5'-phosphate oxidase family protein n=1 Tax=Pseudonocardia abyssalis TaxID=2792008 RepID=A0ABS6UZC2_9PSEU|nr:pyridoxamine 5'-phosphate oxidase family protein [Pseudonocardia abyssalis]MBW0116191.1 pyridoxamine 5'-phosphate oxidase family protein [Pseudonocardia abyssalis]MBW0137620.1 pyridoxamine 5'-phosphate oxidase family protein [Pseudonocardia abyssalis]
MMLTQGDPALLDTDIARGLLASTEPARLAYTATDGTPRVLPMWFLWSGDELVLASFAGSAKVAALRARPDVAITIDTLGPPPDVLLLRGRVELTEVAGVLPEYTEMQVRYLGAEFAAAARAEVDVPGVRMVRIGLRPTWVGALDFRTRFPAGFAERGR